MNLSCATHFPKHMPGHLAGKPTRFRERILNTLLEPTAIGKEIFKVKAPIDFKPHSIRKGKRWRAGMDIHFFEWTGKPYRSPHFKFAPVMPCKSVQDIEIHWHDPDGCLYVNPIIYVDGVWLTGKKLKQLAINDGFPNLESFYGWFNQDFSGQIIHWTYLRY